MPNSNRMIEHILDFTWPCDTEWKSRHSNWYLVSNYKIQKLLSSFTVWHKKRYFFLEHPSRKFSNELKQTSRLQQHTQFHPNQLRNLQEFEHRSLCFLKHLWLWIKIKGHLNQCQNEECCDVFYHHPKAWKILVSKYPNASQHSQCFCFCFSVLMQYIKWGFSLGY